MRPKVALELKGRAFFERRERAGSEGTWDRYIIYQPSMEVKNTVRPIDQSETGGLSKAMGCPRIKLQRSTMIQLMTNILNT